MSRLLTNEAPLTAAEKRALLAEVLRKKAAQRKTAPLSFAQQRLWILSQLEPDSHAYNIPRALILKGTLQAEALRTALKQILARHEALRANFDLINGEPVQFIASSNEIMLPQTDLEGLPEREQKEEVKLLVAEEARRPFDLARDRLLRAALLRLAPDEHLLLLTVHHIVSDGWSMGVLVRELSALYDGISQDRPVQLPDLPIQYADFARWQREWLQGEVLEKQLSYWREQLQGAPAVLDLPSDRPRPSVQTSLGGFYRHSLSKELRGALDELSRREGVTLFMTLLAAFQTLLMRYSGVEDVVVGSPIAGRTRAETEDLIGFFVNTLALRTDLSGNPKFTQLLKRVKEVSLGAFANQDLPFEKLVEELHPERSLSYSPIFQVMFVLQNQPRSLLSLSGLEITTLLRETETSKFDLTLYVTEGDQGLATYFEYNSAMFDPGTIERMAKHFGVLLEGIAANPSLRIAQLPILTPAERRQIITEWNQTERGYPTVACVHELFEAQVELTPGDTALVAGDERMSYRELNARANQLAHYLRSLGVGPENRVAICLSRSARAIVAVMATLKAGAAYVALDPAYPRERLNFMLRDSGATVLLTERTVERLLSESESKAVCLDSDWKIISQQPSTNPVRTATPNNLAYVIYTSGSTGSPKGVAIEHHSTVTFLNWARETFSPEELKSTLLSTSLCFDLSVFELFAPLSCGGRVVLVENALHLPEVEEEVTLVNTVPSAMTELVRSRALPASLRTVNLAGEPLQNSLVQEIYAQPNIERVLNLYGPSEDTTYSTFVKLERGAHEEPTIGRPLANTEVYLLDAQLEPVPVGLAGELFLSGAGLARCYLDKPEITAERFIPNPFSTEPGRRMYRTGDLARYLTDGSIQFLGRVDHQVKLRGYRIELGEIEAKLREHPDVENVVAVAEVDQKPGLVAYVVGTFQDGDKRAAAELKAHLKQTLPDYMIPAVFVFMAELPLTPNGKIDRRALPVPDFAATAEKSVESAVGEVETAVVEIWKRLLQVDSIGLKDNFFDLGGHSLLAVRMLSEIERATGNRIPLVMLFQDATVERLASILRQGLDSYSWPTLVQIQPGTGKPRLFCVSAPNVNALGYVFLARYLGSDQPVYGLQSQYPEDLEGEHSQFVVEELAAEYLKALREMQPQGPYQFIGMCRGAHIAFEMARQLKEEGQTVALLGVLDTWVLENTYSYFWYVEYYARRISSLLKMAPRKQWALLGEKARSFAKGLGGLFSPQQNGEQAISQGTALRQAYFPGEEFVPRVYDGRITVFRARRQPLNRIRDRQLGWSRLATGEVDVHFVPGRHGWSVLTEPHVRVLAQKLKDCMLTGDM